MQYRFKKKGIEWRLIVLDSGWVDVRMVRDGELTRTQLKALDIESALQYVWSNYNGAIEPITKEQLEEME